MPNQNQKSDLSRREFIVKASTVGATALLGSVVSPVMAQSKQPLRIGVLNSFSGVFAALGNDNLNGMNLYFDEIGGSIAGRKIQILKEDDEIKPQVGLQKLRKLVESDKCDILTGIQSSSVAMAAVAYLRQSGAFMLCSGAGATSLSIAKTKLPYFFRCSINTGAIHRTFGDWYYKNVSKEVLLTASDFVGGRDTLAEFKSGFQPHGGKIITEIYPPLGNNDFSPYLATIRKDAPPGTFNFYAGTDAVRFVKQYAEYGLKKMSKLTGSGFMLESDTLPAQGSSALGALSSLHYTDTLDNAANKKFVADYLAKYKKYPSVYSEYGYVAAQILHAAIDAVHGDTRDKDALRKAMLALRLDAPRGPFRFNPKTQGPIQNVYVREVVELGDRFTNKVIYTYPNVV